MPYTLLKRILFAVLLTSVGKPGEVFAGVIVTVSGQANPYLAGMPNGSTAQYGDRAPQQSPAAVSGLVLVQGLPVYFSATGSVSYNGSVFNGPDGGFVFSRGAENGFAGYTLTANSLLGVFLGASQPNLSVAPAALDFTTPESREFLTLSPSLKQPFFIGDGKTSNGMNQQFIVPIGATRLFLGTADGGEWLNNAGSFSVHAWTAAVPEPSGAIAMTLILVGYVIYQCASCPKTSGSDTPVSSV